MRRQFPEAAAAIRAAITPTTKAELLDDWPEWRLAIEVPAYVAPVRTVEVPTAATLAAYAAEMRAGDCRVRRTVRWSSSASGRENISVHAPDTGLTKGAAVEVGALGHVRLLAYPRADGTTAHVIVRN